jgi:hypothetical protein
MAKVMNRPKPRQGPTPGPLQRRLPGVALDHLAQLQHRLPGHSGATTTMPTRRLPPLTSKTCHPMRSSEPLNSPAWLRYSARSPGPRDPSASHERMYGTHSRKARDVLSYRYATSPDSTHAGYSTTNVAAQQGYSRSDDALTLRIPFHDGCGRLQRLWTATEPAFPLVNLGVEPPPESNRRPHLYHRWSAPCVRRATPCCTSRHRR